MIPADVDQALPARLLAEVRRLKTITGRTRAVPTLVNVGSLGAERLAFAADVGHRTRTAAGGRPEDRGLRADLLTRALDRLGDPTLRSVWLTRGGSLVVGEQDLLWRAAAETAFARHGVSDPGRLACFVVTRHGWLDVREEQGRSWSRLRSGPAPSPAGPARDEDGTWPLTR